MASFGKITFFLVVLITCCFMLAENAANINILELQCSVNNMEEVGDAERTIMDVMDHLTNKTVTSQYNYEYQERVGDSVTWGNAACNGALSNDDCVECIRVTRDYVIMACPFKAGAHIKLTDCRMRFEPYEFHGPW